MKYQIDCENGIANVGNLYRMQQLIARAKRKEPLTLGFLGGSITQGSLSSTPQLCYAYRVFSWWEKTFPDTNFTYVNAGIGGTTSQFGAARVEQDLLAKEPDFVIVEFSVNDESTPLFLETYEGLVRKIYQSKSAPAVLLVNNVRYDDGGNAQIQHGKVARHYNLPQVSMQSSIYPKVVQGKIKNEEITPDDLHPNDEGHELVAGVITHFLHKVVAKEYPVEQKDIEMIAPLTKNSYETAFRIQNYNSTPKNKGWNVDESKQTAITEFFKNGWYADQKGASIEFEVESSELAIQYRKSVKHPAAIASVMIDDDVKHKIILDGKFEETWGDCLYLQTIVHQKAKKVRKIRITIESDYENDIVPFYLVSIIGANF